MTERCEKRARWFHRCRFAFEFEDGMLRTPYFVNRSSAHGSPWLW